MSNKDREKKDAEERDWSVWDAASAGDLIGNQTSLSNTGDFSKHGSADYETVHKTRRLRFSHSCPHLSAARG